MIDFELLRGIRKVVAHGREGGPCADGLAAALIVRNALPEVAVEFVQYESAELRELAVEPGLLFLDITPLRERASEFLAAESLVLDHHATMEDVTKRFAVEGQGAYASEEERGVSAATLAYREVWIPLMRAKNLRLFLRHLEEQVAHFAKLAGIYDTWKKEDPLWSKAREQTAVLYFFPADDWLADWELFASGSLQRRLLELGPLLLRKERERALELVAGAYRFETLNGTRVAVLASSMISDAADLVEDADVVIGFSYRVRGGVTSLPRDENVKPSMKISFRSRGGYEVRRIAEALGGGGHKTAASAWLDLREDWAQPQPYEKIRALMAAW